MGETLRRRGLGRKQSDAAAPRGAGPGAVRGAAALLGTYHRPERVNDLNGDRTQKGQTRPKRFRAYSRWFVQSPRRMARSGLMARRLRIESPRALYHVINRGNYRQAVFASAGASHALEQTFLEIRDRFPWRLHAQVVMRNHDHLALQTPAPTLAAGVHWLHGTFATRLNRFR